MSRVQSDSIFFSSNIHLSRQKSKRISVIRFSLLTYLITKSLPAIGSIIFSILENPNNLQGLEKIYTTQEAVFKSGILRYNKSGYSQSASLLAYNRILVATTAAAHLYLFGRFCQKVVRNCCNYFYEVIMNEALRVLEYPKIIQKLTDYAGSQPGKSCAEI